MVNNSGINFKNLSKKGYSNSDIQRITEISDEVQNNHKDINILPNRYGDGKSTAIESTLQAGDIFSMGNYSQIMEKLLDCKTDHKVLNRNEKYQLLVGKLKWLGLRWEGEDLVRDPDRVYQKTDPWVWNRNSEKIEKYDIESERKKQYVDQIRQDIEDHGLKNAWDYHKDKEIVEKYGYHLHTETRSRTINFTPIDMIDLVSHMDRTGDLVVDEGLGGKGTEIGKLENYIETMEKLTGKQVNSKTSRPRCNIPSIDDTGLKKDITDLWKKVREIIIELYDSLEESHHSRYDGRFVYRHITDLVDEADITEMCRYLKRTRRKNRKNMERIEAEKISCGNFDKIKRINDLIELAEFIQNSQKDYAMIGAFRDSNNSVKSLKCKYPKYYDVLQFGCGVTSNVYILNASIDRTLPKLYVDDMKFSPSVVTHCKDAGIDTIEESELVTEHVQFGYGSNQTMSKQNLSSQKFKETIVKLIDWFDGENFVTSVMRNDRGEIVPEMFETESSNFATIEGSNKARDADNLFVIGANRMNNKDMWILVKNRYQEIIEFSDKEWEKLMKTDKEGSQIGWKDPEEEIDYFEWEGNYDFNPLQKIWTQLVDRHKFEKMNRKRYQDKDRGEGYVVNMGIRPTIGGRKFGRNRGDEMDMIKFLIEERKGTALEKSQWIKDNIKPRKYMEDCVPEGLPLRIILSEGENKWKIDYWEFLEDRLMKESFNSKTKSKEERELYKTVEEITNIDIDELPFTKRTLQNWVKDSIYVDYIAGQNQNDMTKFKASDFSTPPWEEIREPPSKFN